MLLRKLNKLIGFKNNCTNYLNNLQMLIPSAYILNELGLPPIIYKYRIWDKMEHKRILLNNEIFYSTPMDCDEQHECNLPIDYDSVTQEMLFKYFYLTAPYAVGSSSEKSRSQIATSMVVNSPFHDQSNRIRLETKFRQELNKKVSIFCASTQNDNYNLWSSFAGGDSGFCVGFDTQKLLEIGKNIGGVGKVYYYPQNNPPKRKPFYFSENERLADMMQVIFSLPVIYEKEIELRFIKYNLTSNRIHIEKDLIKEVILNQHINKLKKDDILNIIKERLPHVSVQQCEFDSKSCRYSFKRLN